MELTITYSDLGKTCRLCLASDKPMIDIIYLSFPKIKMETVHQIVECDSVQITKQDALSHLICVLCCNQLEKIIQFQRQALESENTLRHYLRQVCTDDTHSDSGYSIQKPVLDVIDHNLTSKIYMDKDGAQEDIKDPLFFCEVLEDINREETFIKPWTSSNPETDADSKDGTLGSCEFTKVTIKGLENDDSVFLTDANEVDKIDDIDINPETKMDIDEPKTSMDETFNQVETIDSPTNSNMTNKNLSINDRDTSKTKRLICNICNKRFAGLSNLKKHTQRHRNNDLSNLKPKKLLNSRPLQCDVCFKDFTNSHCLETHKLEHTGEKSYQCEVCNKCFAQLVILNTHKLLHNYDKPYQCDVCKRSFDHLESFNYHKLSHTDEKPECDICKKCFTSWHYLKIHKLVHTGERPHQCDVCNKSFTQLGTLKTHKLQHTGEKPYQCDICSKYFTSVHHLNRHKLLHTGVKPYQCDICNKRFTYLYSLKIHKFVHTDDKPYECEICKRSFTTSINLGKHKLVHTGEKPHQCDVCYKYFNRKENMKRHKKIIHSIEE